ncbi:pyruvate dehydrogenase complex dihydrolipoamide acetyltransferase, partial [Mesorhizobium sp. M7A.F.Ca.MR.228.00.0.0]
SPVEPTPPDRPAAGHPPLEGEGKARATPLARRLAREAGLNLSTVSGTGPYGRVVKADIDAALSSLLEGEVSAKRTEGGAS